MNQYEVLYIIAPDLDEEATRASIEKYKEIVASNGGEVVSVDEWGKKKLAYEIKDCMDGYYCLFYVKCEPACVKEVDRVMKITDELLKHMIVVSEEPDAAPQEAAAEKPAEE